jgi:excisionase family DNA binding protein
MERIALNPNVGRPPGVRPAFSLMAEKQIAQQVQLKAALMSDPWLRPREIMALLGLGYTRVRAMIRSGEMRASRTSAHGHFRCRLSEVRRVAKALEYHAVEVVHE